MCGKGVIASGAFDGDDQVREGVPVPGVAQGPQRRLEAGLVVVDDGRRHEDSAVEVGEHPFGSGLGAVDADDPEVLWPDGLDPWMKDAPRLVDDVGLSSTAFLRPGRSGHAKGPPGEGLEWIQLPHWKSAWR
jgi:hypothetical protein